MPIYIQREPEQVEAIQFTGSNFADMEEFCEGITFNARIPNGRREAILPNSKQVVGIGDYIEKFEYEGVMEYTVSDKDDFEHYYKLLK